MFLHKIKQKKIAKKIYTNYKYIYKTKKLSSILNTTNICYFFFFTTLSKQKEFELQMILHSENLKFLKIKKNLLKSRLLSNNFQFLNNLIKNNVLVIFNTTSSEINLNLIKNITNLKNFFLFGIWNNKKFFRPSEIQTISKINKTSLNLNLIQFNNYNKKIILKNLIISKKYA